MSARRIAVIMAGGGGTRLWPASTGQRPKHLLDPLPDARGGTRSLLRRTVERLSGLVASADVWVVTGASEAQAVRQALPEVAAEQIVVEPARRNTAPCVALAARLVRARLGDGAEATLLALPADHHVGRPDRFVALLRAACVHAEASGAIATLGITPDHPATGYGYMERAADPLPAVPGDGGEAVYPALRFVEKPDEALARRFLASGRYVWNAGVFAMPLSRIEREMQRHCAATWAALSPVHEAAAAGRDPTDAIATAYAGIEAVPIDVAIMERQDDLRVVPAEVAWADLGSWAAIHSVGTPDAAGNVVAAPSAVALDSKDCLLWSDDATIGVIGIEGLAVVASGGRVLVCPLHRAQEVRALLAELQRED